MSDEAVRFDVDGPVATATLDQPDRRNALSPEIEVGLRAALEATLDSDARCLVIEGAGGAFSAGGDIEKMRRRIDGAMPIDERVRALETTTSDVIARIVRFPLPTVSKIDGPAVGAGANLAIATDVQLASDRSVIGFVFRGVGLSVDAGTSYLLPRLVGTNIATELVLTGEIVDAERALDLGLFNHVYPTDEFDERADELIATVATGPTVALRHAARLVREGLEKSLDEALLDEARAQGIVFGTHDHEEGVRAFLEKRDAEFEGR